MHPNFIVISNIYTTQILSLYWTFIKPKFYRYNSNNYIYYNFIQIYKKLLIIKYLCVIKNKFFTGGNLFFPHPV